MDDEELETDGYGHYLDENGDPIPTEADWKWFVEIKEYDQLIIHTDPDEYWIYWTDVNKPYQASQFLCHLYAKYWWDDEKAEKFVDMLNHHFGWNFTLEELLDYAIKIDNEGETND